MAQTQSLKSAFKPLQTKHERQSHQAKNNAEAFKTQRIKRNGKGCRPHDDRIKRTKHHSDDKMKRL